MKTVLLFLASFVLMGSEAFATGGMVGNGGDAVLQEFNLRGIQMANYFATETLIAKAVGIDAPKFLEIVKSTKLEGQDHLLLAGVEVDAINYPSEKRIVVSRSRWQESAKRLDSFFVQRRIALHEYLWVYGIDDTNYVVSNQVIEQFERSAGHDADPVVQDLLRVKLCEALDARLSPGGKVDFSAAEKYLSWGLDPNVLCPEKPDLHKSEYKMPLAMVFFSYQYQPVTGPDEAARLHLIESMLRFGADPNGYIAADITAGQLENGYYNYNSIRGQAAAVAAQYDLNVLRTLFKFGADPNFVIVNEMQPIFLALKAGYSDPAPSVDAFQIFMDAGLDVNAMTPASGQAGSTNVARAVVRYLNADALVEALMKSGKVDWCSFGDSVHMTRLRPIDAVADAYKPLIVKYNISCPKIFGPIWGREYRCEDETADALKQCQAKGFSRVTEILENGKSGCRIEGDVKTEYTIHSGTYYCEGE